MDFSDANWTDQTLESWVPRLADEGVTVLRLRGNAITRLPASFLSLIHI